MTAIVTGPGAILFTAMTKVEIEYALTGPLTDDLMEAVSRAHAIYGLLMIRPSRTLDSLLVQYDASRLKLEDVDHALLRANLPVRRAA